MPENETLLYDARDASRRRPLAERMMSSLLNNPSRFPNLPSQNEPPPDLKQIAPHAEVYQRYRREWMLLIADARRRSFPWITPAGSLAAVEGAAS